MTTSDRIGGARLDDAPERPGGGSDLLRLDGNEGPAPPRAVLAALEGLEPEVLRRYPDKGPLEARLAELHGVAPEQVLVDTGGDGTIAAFATAFLAPGQRFVHTTPTFVMIPARAELRGATLAPVAWRRGPFPTAAFVDAVSAPGAVGAIVTPNNPTGGQATVAEVLAAAQACAPEPLLLDLAYVEFGDVDPSAAALDAGNVVVLRTLSKALGLAGLRVGYAIGPPPLVDRMRAVTPPYPCSSVSLLLAQRALDLGLPTADAVRRVRAEREALRGRLIGGGLDVPPSGGNFVTVFTPRAPELFTTLRERGVLVRRFEGRSDAADLLRISVPTDDLEAARLAGALEAALDRLARTAPDEEVSS